MFRKVNDFFFIQLLRQLLILSDSVDINPGPINLNNQKLSFAVWKLDSIPARNFNRLPQIECFQSVYNFDIFGVCESSLTNQIPNEDIKLSGFSPLPFRFGKQDNVHNGGVCLYYKENLPIKQRVDLRLFNKTIVAEISFLPFFIISDRHPNQSAAEVANYEFHEFRNHYCEFKVGETCLHYPYR